MPNMILEVTGRGDFSRHVPADPSYNRSMPTLETINPNTTREATLDDLARVEGKAELIDGRIIRLMPTGGRPGFAARQILRRLADHEDVAGDGTAFGDNVAFVVDLPHRRSFSPDAAYHVTRTVDMQFVQGAPLFAVEVRSENDDGPRAERAMADKRSDYFAAGTLVVWDVDVAGEPVVRKYKADQSDHPAVFRAGDVADAEPAVPGWSMPVTELVRG